MVCITNPHHQRSLLQGLDRLRMNGLSTDVTLVSCDGCRYNVHSLILQALGISDHIPSESHKSEVIIAVSGAALAIVISFLYTGVLNLSSASISTVTDIDIFAKGYHLDSLKQILLDHRKSIAETVTRPTIKLLQVKHTGATTTAIQQHKLHKFVNNVDMKASQYPENETYQNDTQMKHMEEKESIPSKSTKELLRAFLDKKGEQEETHDRNTIQNQLPQKILHRPDVICCDLCGKIIAKKGFPAHMRIHNNIKNKICEICGKQFRKACNLQEHWQRMHSSSKCYICDRCGANFAIKSDLTRHVARHQKTCFVCELCGASFVGKMMWKKHKCMDNIFDSDDLDTVFGKRNESNGKSSPHDQETDDILNIGTLLPLELPEMTGSTEILSEIDGLFYENST